VWPSVQRVPDHGDGDRDAPPRPPNPKARFTR
jgi:hypothetical protein